MKIGWKFAHKNSENFNPSTRTRPSVNTEPKAQIAAGHGDSGAPRSTKWSTRGCTSVRWGFLGRRLVSRPEMHPLTNFIHPLPTDRTIPETWPSFYVHNSRGRARRISGWPVSHCVYKSLRRSVARPNWSALSRLHRTHPSQIYTELGSVHDMPQSGSRTSRVRPVSSSVDATWGHTHCHGGSPG